MVKIIKPTLWTKANRDMLLGLIIISCVLLTLICSGIIALLTVRVTSIIATPDFHYIVKADGKEYTLVPSDVLRIERTPAKKAITGQEITILKIYTKQGFIYSIPDDQFYSGAQKLAGAADWYGLPIWMNTDQGVTLEDVRKKGYAIGTPQEDRPILFAVLGLQNLLLLVAGLALVALIFPLRIEKDNDSTPVVSRVEQPA